MKINGLKKTLRVFEIRRMAIHNGPGFRTMIHLKGCPLRCMWCSTPESQRPGAEMAVERDKCISCGKCITKCEESALKIEENGKINLDRSWCNACGDCCDACPAEALSLIGNEYTADELLRIIVKDQMLYEKSGGGVVFSGGEPLMQINEAFLCLLERLKAEHISVGIDTCGYAETEILEKAAEFTDYFLWDLKLIDPGLHKKYTGLDNSLILKNLRYVDEKGIPVYLRCPIIPGINNTAEHIQKLSEVAAGLKHVAEIDLLPLHHMGTSRYEKMGRKDLFAETQSPSEYEMEQYKKLLENAGFRVRIIG